MHVVPLSLPAQARSQPFVAIPSASKKPVAHAPIRQVEPMHEPLACAGAQTCPHPPQLFRSVAKFALRYSHPLANRPSQLLCPAAQPEMPQVLTAQKVVASCATQALVHAPHVSGSDVRSCSGLATFGQLSARSGTPSPSVSGP
jgi:hypothetical protein